MGGRFCFFYVTFLWAGGFGIESAWFSGYMAVYSRELWIEHTIWIVEVWKVLMMRSCWHIALYSGLLGWNGLQCARAARPECILQMEI